MLLVFLFFPNLTYYSKLMIDDEKGLILFLLFVVLLCASTKNSSLLRTVNQSAKWITGGFCGFDSDDEDERIAQLFMVAAGSDNRYIATRVATDVLLCRRWKSAASFSIRGAWGRLQVTNKIQSPARTSIYSAFDGEWGLSMRLSGTTRFPKNMMLGAIRRQSSVWRIWP